MYIACTFQLVKALPFPPLMVIPNAFVYLALAAWTATFMGMLFSLFPKRA